MAKNIDYYLLIIWKDVQPELFGAYSTAKERNAVAKLKYRAHGDDNGYFRLNVPKGTSVEVGCIVEPDGCCEHGCKSWLLVLGLI